MRPRTFSMAPGVARLVLCISGESLLRLFKNVTDMPERPRQPVRPLSHWRGSDFANRGMIENFTHRYLKSLGRQRPYRFKSGSGHHVSIT